MDVKKKRDRTPNFTDNEIKSILKLCSASKVIENKRTDGATNAQKAAEWEKIALAFNSSNSIHRPVSTLKTKYEALKKGLRKKCSSHTVYMRGTGGGGPFKPPPSLTEEETELFHNIELSCTGLPMQEDSDAGIGDTTVGVIDETREESVEEYHARPFDYSVDYLRRPLSEALQAECNTDVRNPRYLPEVSLDDSAPPPENNSVVSDNNIVANIRSVSEKIGTVAQLKAVLLKKQIEHMDQVCKLEIEIKLEDLRSKKVHNAIAEEELRHLKLRNKIVEDELRSKLQLVRTQDEDQ